jgi:hypothetical protein
MKAQTIRKMPKGAGKAEMSLDRICLDSGENCPISGMLVFSLDGAEPGGIGEIQRLVSQTAPEDLRIMAGSSILAVRGFEDTEAEIYEIPEVRAFFKEQNQTCSPWLFAGTVSTADLLAIVLACLPTVFCWRQGDDLFVRWEESEMRAFLNKALPTAAFLCHRAGIGKEEGRALLKAAAAYIGLPFSK